MDRNLGASQVATSSMNLTSFGDLYQWGRRADGHQCRNSTSTGTLSSVDQPTHGSFIMAPGVPYDWRNPQNTNLWQGVDGVNNPCPSDYRLPTEAEFNAELMTWSSATSTGAFASPLKFPMGGFRNYNNGSVSNAGTGGSYWSSTVSGIYSLTLGFSNSGGYVFTDGRARGRSIRCIKD